MNDGKYGRGKNQRLETDREREIMSHRIYKVNRGTGSPLPYKAERKDDKGIHVWIEMGGREGG